MTDLSLSRVSSGSVRRRGHTQDPVLGLIGILQERDGLFRKGSARYARPTRYSANYPAILFELLLVGVAEVVEQYRVQRPLRRYAGNAQQHQKQDCKSEYWFSVCVHFVPFRGNPNINHDVQPED